MRLYINFSIIQNNIKSQEYIYIASDGNFFTFTDSDLLESVVFYESTCCDSLLVVIKWRTSY